MKHALRDILLIVALFGAIVAAPLVMDMFTSGKDETPAEKLAARQEKPESTSTLHDVPMDGMPPQPKPSDGTEEKSSVMERLTHIDDDAVKPQPAESEPPQPAPAEPQQGGSSLTLTLRGDAQAPADMDASNCSDVRLGDAQPYNPVISTGMKGSSFILPTADLGKMTIVGGKGYDTLKPDGEGAVDIEGKHVRSIEIYDVRNDKPNKVRVFAAGLAAMSGRHALIVGDKLWDVVEFDPCLDWNDPIAIEDGAEPMLRYDAHDRDGNQASVTVTDGVKVFKPVVSK